MADGDGTAIDIELVLRDAELVAAVEHLAGKRFVELPQADVVHLQARALQQPRHGEHRADAHFIGFAASHRKAAEDAHGLDVAPRGFRVGHQHAGAGTIGKLTGVAGGNKLVIAAHWFQLGETLQIGVWPIAFVALQRDGALGDLLGLLVLDLHQRCQRYDLRIEPPGLLGGRRALLALERILVLLGAADAVPPRDNIRGFDHRHIERTLVLDDPLVTVKFGVHIHLHEAYRFEPARYRHRHALLFDGVGGERDRLQSRRAEPIDGLRCRRYRQTSPDGTLPGDIAARRAFGIGATHHHVLDVARLDAGPLDRVSDHMPAQLGAMREVEGTAYGATDRRAGGGDDDGVDHGEVSFYRVGEFCG